MKKMLCSLLCFAMIFALCSCTQKAPEEVKIYATVNGEKLTQNEIDYFSSRLKAAVMREFAEEYGVEDFSDFWESEYGGKSPAAVLEERAFDEAVNAKIRLLQMKKYGIYDGVSFEELKTYAEDFNKRNEGVDKKVGIKSIDMSQFYTYLISTGEMELKNILEKGDLAPTEDEIKAYVAENDGEDFSDNLISSNIVDEKYEKLISELIENAEIIKTN